MDPNANIREQIALIDEIVNARRDGRSSRVPRARYDELRRAYSEWRALGGFPADDRLLTERTYAQMVLCDA